MAVRALAYTWMRPVRYPGLRNAHLACSQQLHQKQDSNKIPTRFKSLQPAHLSCPCCTSSQANSAGGSQLDLPLASWNQKLRPSARVQHTSQAVWALNAARLLARCVAQAAA